MTDYDHRKFYYDYLTFPAYWICSCGADNKIESAGYRYHCGYCDAHRDHYDIVDYYAFYSLVDGLLVPQKPSDLLDQS